MMLGTYRSIAFVQLAAGAEPVALYRGNVLAAGPSAAEGAAAAERGLLWLRGAQNPDGSFSAAYLPYADKYETKVAGIVQQAGAALALFTRARLRSPAPGETRPGLQTDSDFLAGEKTLGYLEKTAVKDKRFKYIRNYTPENGYHECIYVQKHRPMLRVIKKLDAEGKLTNTQQLILAKK